MIYEDPNGVTGSLLHYSLVIFMVCSAFFIFLYLWRKGRLDMDEAPKHQMLQESEVIERKDEYDGK